MDGKNYKQNENNNNYVKDYEERIKENEEIKKNILIITIKIKNY